MFITKGVQIPTHFTGTVKARNIYSLRLSLHRKSKTFQSVATYGAACDPRESFYIPIGLFSKGWEWEGGNPVT